MTIQNLKQPIRGARDFYPQELSIRNWLFNCWRETAKKFGYEEIDGPILESFDLFASKSGEELVNQQMYTMEDRDNRKIGVRPELTPTYSRMVAQKQGELVFPLRWMMFGPVWRYEKPQTGRSRDFWQWELNLVGGDENTADAEIIVIAAKAMTAIGLTPQDVVFRINDRRYIQEQLAIIGITDKLYSQTVKAIDRKEKIQPVEFNKYLEEIGLNPDQISKLNIFLSDTDFSKSEKLTSLFSLLEKYGVSDYCQYDPLIVRGITYYTGTVFECFDRSKKFRSVFGGGRFDDLVETFGGGKVPAVGYAIGDVVVTELLKSLNKLPSLQINSTKLLVTIFSPDLITQSLNLSVNLRSQDINVELHPDPSAKLDKQLKYAAKKGIPYIAILGPEEIASNSVKIKNMQTGEQKSVSSNSPLTPPLN